MRRDGLPGVRVSFGPSAPVRVAAPLGKDGHSAQSGAKVIIHLIGRVLPGRWNDLVSFLRDAIPFYERPGGITVRLLRDEADPDAFIEVIEYDSEHAYAADQRRVEADPEMIARLREWHGLLAGDLEVRTFAEVTPSSAEPRQGDPP
ncbi:hypothetical protein Asp14428_75510 [Actinoplanes sp. NBRC 14428]|nr:hypothetical protein Asp14428_75510 [Actinoplanes sp. NBRC 14428]